VGENLAPADIATFPHSFAALFKKPVAHPPQRPAPKILAARFENSGSAAMSDLMTGTRADWLSLWRRAAAERGYTQAEVEHRAGLTDKYLSRLACGDIGEPTAATIAKINRALNITIDAKILDFDSLHGV
jgi:DNA-binding phage protein